MLDALRRGGLPPEAVTLQVATGLHRPCTPAELREMLGDELASSLRIVQHDARDAASHVDLGHTRGGMPIRIDRFFLERDLRLVTGLIEPHLMAGYSGGRKAVCPGLAAVETLRVAHGPALLEGHIGPGLVDGNPLHEALLEVVRRVGVHFMLNVALDRERRVAGVFCGDIERAHAAGMRFVEAESLVSLDAAADLVIVSAGGDPLDATFYQAIKGIAAASAIVRPGGSDSAVRRARRGGGQRLVRAAAARDREPRRLRAAARRRRLLRDRSVDDPAPVSGAPARAHPALLAGPPGSGPARAARRAGGVAARGSRERAWQDWQRAPRIAVLPQGPYVLATLRGEKRPLGRAA